MDARDRPRWNSRDRERQLDDEGRALGVAVALRHDAATVELDEMLDQRQAETEAGMHSGARAVRLAKTLEDHGQDARRDALPGVADDDLDVGVHPLQVHLDPAAPRCELHRIDEQVPHDLLEPVRIARDRPRARIEHALQTDPLGFGGRPHGVEGRLDDGREIHLADVEAHLARDDARDVEQVVDQLDLGVGIALDDLERAGRRGLALDLSGTQHARPAVDRIQRRTELVRQDRQKLIFRAVRRLGGRPRVLLLEQERLAVRLDVRAFLGSGHEGVGDVTNLLNGRVRRAGRLASAERLGGAAEVRHRAVDAPCDPHGRERAEGDREQDAAPVDRERTIAGGLDQCRGNAQSHEPTARLDAGVRRVDSLALEGVRFAEPGALLLRDERAQGR